MKQNLLKIIHLPTYQKVLALLLLVALIGTGYYFFLFKEKQRVLRVLTKRQNHYHRKLNRTKKIVASYPKVKKEYEKAKAKMALAAKELPNDKEIPSLLSNIATLAQNQGLDVIAFKPLPSKRVDFYEEVPISLELLGTYPDLTKFLYSVGEMPRIVNVDDFKVTPETKAKSEHPTLTTKCVATTFRFLPNTKAGKTKKVKKVKK